MFKRELFFLLLMFNIYSIVSQDDKLKLVDSISYLFENIKDENKPFIERLSYAERAKRLSKKIDNDSLINQSLRYIALHHYNLKNYNLLKNQ